MAKYRKKPVEVEAIQWTGRNDEEIQAFVGKRLKVNIPHPDMVRILDNIPDDAYSIVIPTLEGDMNAVRWDWIIKGVQGEFYPCKPDIFKKTYEPIKED